MQAIQENKFSMYLVVKEFLSGTVAVNDTIPKFNDNIVKLNGNILLIHDARERQELKRKGISVSKRELKSRVIDLAIDVARKTMAYAVNEEDSVIAAEMNYNKSELEKSADTILRDQCQVIHDRAKAHLAVLEDYDLKASDFLSLQEMINSYTASIPLPRTGVLTKKKATAQLAELFLETDALLDKMDTLTEMVRKSNPEFYNSFKNSRLLTNSSNRKLAIRGTFKNVSGEAVGNVTYTIDGIDRKFKSTPKGNFQLQSLASGAYVLRYSKNGFANGKADVFINDGERTDVDIVLG